MSDITYISFGSIVTKVVVDDELLTIPSEVEEQYVFTRQDVKGTELIDPFLELLSSYFKNKVLLCFDVLTSAVTQEYIVAQLFETYSVGQILITTPGSIVLLGAGLSHGVCLDIGWGKMNITAVINPFDPNNQSKSIQLGILDVRENLLMMLSDYDLYHTVDIKDVNKMIEQRADWIAETASDWVSETEGAKYETITLGDNLAKALKVIFTGCLCTEEVGLTNLWKTVFDSVAIDSRRGLFESIVFTGVGSKFQNASSILKVDPELDNELPEACIASSRVMVDDGSYFLEGCKLIPTLLPEEQWTDYNDFATSGLKGLRI